MNQRDDVIGGTKRRFSVIAFVGVVAFTLLTISSSMPVLAGESGGTGNGWVWTKEYPKPDWWRWDDVYSKEKPVRGGYYQSAAIRYIGLMNPNHWPVHGWMAMVLMYDRLVYPDGTYRAAVPWLAEQWKFENPTTVLMTLRKGVEFHDGSAFNAHSVKYQMDWINDRKNGAWTRNLLKPVKSVEVVDEHTVRWHFKYAWAGFADIMFNVPGLIMSTKALKADVALQDTKRLKNKIKIARKKLAKAEKKSEQAAAKGGAKAKKAAAKLKKARRKLAALKKQLKKAQADTDGFVGLDFKAVGSGPFMVEEARPGNYLKLKRNPNWWFGRSIGKPEMPYFDGRKVTVIPEPSVQLANLKAGKIDWLNVQKSQYPQVKDDPNLDVWVTPLNFTSLLAFNHKKGPFKDIRLRKAVSHAIDRKALIAANERGFGRVASCHFPSDHYAHNPNLKPVPYNPELSRKLLAQAGYPDGLTVKGVIYSNTASVRFGQIVKAMLKRVNITWELEMHDPVAAADKYRNLEYELGVLTGQYIRSPDSAMTLFYDPDAEEKNKRIENPGVMAMIKAARQELNFEKRKKMYWDIEKALYDNYDDAWLYHPTLIAAERKQARGYNREMSIVGGEAYYPTHPGWFRNGRRH
ncbi:MAG: ABC transporter substrate-binding protein [Proteobacteria bacterium]|nr:ABC transporter substrate-binding protein [Pseudomonadota bacterium]